MNMCPAPNSWKPTASLENLQLRAQLLVRLRDFFAKKNILEVETPLLSHSTIPDPNIHSFSVAAQILPSFGLAAAPIPACNSLYLQTSPEFAMKRLIAAGSGSIYQICKAFRSGEAGNKHNPEFTILEWYRIGFNHHNLMDEMDELLNYILNTKPAERLSYAEVFYKHLQIDPFKDSIEKLQECAVNNGLNKINQLNRNGWLDILMAHFIEPNLGRLRPTFIYDYPLEQSALARISAANPNVAERFEVYVGGVELANGFHELADGKEQRKRFIKDLEQRRRLNLPDISLDENFLAALENGFPDCAGVALGIDRLLMLIAQTQKISDVIAFPGFVS